MSAAKAWLAGAIAFLSTFLDEWTGPEDPLNPRDYIVATLAGIVAFGAVYTVANKPPSQ